MAFFTSFNKKRLFNVDTSEFDYTKLEDLYKKNGPDWEYQLKAVYIGTKSEFDPETPMVAIDGFYVNLPVHQLEEIKEMLGNPRAIKAINEGKAGFIIRHYFQKRFNKDCYSAEWIDVDPADYEDEGSEDAE